MKKFLVMIFVILVFANPGWTLTMADVGDLDDLLATSKLDNYGDDTELSWVEGVLKGLDLIEESTELVLASKTDTTDGYGWKAILDGDGNPTGKYAYDFGPNAYPWFFIKTGKIENKTDQIFVFENLPLLQYGVVGLIALGINPENIEKVSHIGQVAPVPEPATMLLLCTGLIGLAGVSRKKLKK